MTIADKLGGKAAAAAGIRLDPVDKMRDHRRMVVPLNDDTPPALRVPLPDGFVIRMDTWRYEVVSGEADVNGGAFVYTVRVLLSGSDAPPGASSSWPRTLL